MNPEDVPSIDLSLRLHSVCRPRSRRETWPGPASDAAAAFRVMTHVDTERFNLRQVSPRVEPACVPRWTAKCCGTLSSAGQSNCWSESLSYPGYQDKEPDYSPDGTRILFVRGRLLVDAGASSDLSALFVVNDDGSGLRRLTPWRRRLIGTPSWLPDGALDRVPKRFRVWAERRARTDLPDPTGRQRPPAAHVRVEHQLLLAVVVPDGTRIVFSRYTFGEPFQRLYTM
jgi:hypothetical protein